MSLNLEVPLVRTTKNEMEAGSIDGVPAMDMAAAVGAKLPQIDQNYATDDDVLRQVQQIIYPTMSFCRMDRLQLEEEWQAITRMEWMVHDDGQKYKGRANSYLPIYARIQQSLVSALSRGLFPSDEYMDVSDRQVGASDQAKAVKQYLQWEFERVGEVRKKIKPFLRSLVSYGNAVLKYWYDKEPKYQGRGGKKDQGGLDQSPQWGNYGSGYEGLRVSPRNIFHWYIWPYTADGVDEATLVFEDITVPLAYIKARVDAKQFLNGEAALAAPEPDTHANTEQNKFTTLMGLSAPLNSVIASNEMGGVKVLSEVWTYLVLPASAYLPTEEKGCPVPVKIVMAGSVPVEVRRNPFYHQKPPYLFTRLNAQPAMIYGYGHGRLARPLQYLSNDFANQTADVAQFGLNPITVVNPSYLAGPLRPIAPGVTWYMTDAQKGVNFRSPDWELGKVGSEIMNMYMTMAQDLSGAPPIMQGKGGGGANTATGTQILQNNAMQPLQDIVEDIELDILVPLMFGTWLNAQQYRDPNVIMQIGTPNDPLQFEYAMLLLDPQFRWMASSQAVNQSQRAQQLMGIIQVGNGSQQALAAGGNIFNPKPLLERVIVDGFGMRIPPDMWIPTGMPGMMPGAMGGGPPGVPPPGEEPRSAVEQANGVDPSQVQMAPGEGEAFGEVRAGADQLAAEMGGMNGKY